MNVNDSETKDQVWENQHRRGTTFNIHADDYQF